MVTDYRDVFTMTAGTAADYTWRTWVGTATSTSITTIWGTWIDETYVTGSTTHTPTVVRQATAEELAAYELRQQVARQRAQQEALERQEQQAAAVAKAEQLLRDNLTMRQRNQYDAHGHFDVLGESGRCYRISKGQRGHGTDVAELDRRSRVLRRFCTYPRSVEGATWLPEADALLTKKLALEMAEEAFLLIANEYAA